MINRLYSSLMRGSAVSAPNARRVDPEAALASGPLGAVLMPGGMSDADRAFRAESLVRIVMSSRFRDRALSADPSSTYGYPAAADPAHTPSLDIPAIASEVGGAWANPPIEVDPADTIDFLAAAVIWATGCWDG